MEMKQSEGYVGNTEDISSSGQNQDTAKPSKTPPTSLYHHPIFNHQPPLARL
ncbi:hypothetical protein RchiOBHm_Chr1g0349731 [Rosa chinensis]|uniref:Uncharacterized protein n=1 Tax=Rosa chinensis TaxID=74649 RepID=A0A2P6SFX9_ROSCH|nr:hypothetical protein RchiOBHm_Chr1g0349731 [Rosa chinensis]